MPTLCQTLFSQTSMNVRIIKTNAMKMQHVQILMVIIPVPAMMD